MSKFHRPITIFTTTTLVAVFLGMVLLPSIPAMGANNNRNNNNNNSNNNNNNNKKPKTVQKVVITAVSGSTVTITDKEKKETVYTIDSFTRITMQGQTATLNDLKAGQEVLSYVERDPTTLDNIDVGGAAPPAPKK